jgi:long-chain acyl-CoA synthetase
VITDRLYAWAQRRPDDTALVFDEREYGYADFASLVSATAAHLFELGVRGGDHVALMCGNRPAFLAFWFGLSELGAVCVPLNTGLVGDGFCYTLTKSEAKLLIIEPELLATRQQTLASLSEAPTVYEIPEDADTPPTSRGARWGHAGSPDDAALNSILFTSGTTGLPKGVELSHGVYTAASDDMVESLGLTQADRIMVFLPLFHANPQMYAVASVLGCGATLVLLPRFSASRFFDDAVRYRATGFTYVGTVLSILDKHHPQPRSDHMVKWCVGGGAPARVWEALQARFGFQVRELYGMTETGGWVSMNTQAKGRFGSVGHARSGVRVAVVDEAGRVVPTGTKGEIIAQSERPNVFFSAYWRNPEATASVLKNGWLCTGDRGYLDEDGFLYFDGRLKELIRRGGEMIAPTEIEQQLLKHEGVRDCAVAGVPDEIMGEEVHAYVVVEGLADAVALREFLLSRLPGYMAPRYFSFVPAIPKTETQKIQRHLLTKLQAQAIDTTIARS